jgi:hypothetical protein
MKSGVSEREEEEQTEEKARGELEPASHMTPLAQTHMPAPSYHRTVDGGIEIREGHVQKSIRDGGWQRVQR